jgi:uncharacterized membrane protein
MHTRLVWGLAAAAGWLFMVGANAGETSWSTTTVTSTKTTTAKTTGAAGGYVVSTTSVPSGSYSSSPNGGYISSPQTTFSQAYLQPFIYLPAPVPPYWPHKDGGQGQQPNHPVRPDGARPAKR